MSEYSDYFQKTEKYSKAILIVDILIVIVAFAARWVFNVKYAFGAGLILMGVIYLLFPYVRHQKWSEQECKSRLRLSGLIIIVVGIIMICRDVGLI